MVEKDFTRPITHTFQDYSKGNQRAAKKEGGFLTKVEKKIYTKFKPFGKSKSKSEDVLNDRFVTFCYTATIGALLGGGCF